MLGEIKKVQLRKIWKNEAYDFTPWLAENLEQIGEAIGLELEFDSKEVSVGPFSADILAKDTGTDKFVVIENQLEKTNHDHLESVLLMLRFLMLQQSFGLLQNLLTSIKKHWIG